MFLTQSPETIRAVLDGDTGLIGSAFFWHSTPQGYDYWAILHNADTLPREAREYLEETYTIAMTCVHRVPIMTSHPNIAEACKFAERLPGAVIGLTADHYRLRAFGFSDPQSAILFKLAFG